MTKDKQYQIDVTYNDGTSEVYLARGSTIRESKNVIEYIKKICQNRSFTQIYTRELLTKRWELNYHSVYECWMKNGYRIEAENNPGYEDYTGYGNRTDGKRNRFYIGKSMGWIPIYLEILKSNSSGGGTLMHEHRKFKIVNFLNKGY